MKSGWGVRPNAVARLILHRDRCEKKSREKAQFSKKSDPHA